MALAKVASGAQHLEVVRLIVRWIFVLVIDLKSYAVRWPRPTVGAVRMGGDKLEAPFSREVLVLNLQVRRHTMIALQGRYNFV